MPALLLPENMACHFIVTKAACFDICGYIKNINSPYIGIVEGKNIDHPILIQEKRARMKILLIDPQKNIPVATIYSVLKAAMTLYK